MYNKSYMYVYLYFFFRPFESKLATLMQDNHTVIAVGSLAAWYRDPRRQP